MGDRQIKGKIANEVGNDGGEIPTELNGRATLKSNNHRRCDLGIK
jgi:hypothetical protein